MAEMTIHLLTTWGFNEAIIANFVDQEVEADQFSSLTEEDLKILIPDIGPRLRFKINLKKYLAKCEQQPRIIKVESFNQQQEHLDIYLPKRQKLKSKETSIGQQQHNEDIIVYNSNSSSTFANTEYNKDLDLKVLKREKVKQEEISIEQLQHDEDIIIIDSSLPSISANTKYNEDLNLKVLEREKVKQAKVSMEQLQHDEDIIIIDSSLPSISANTKYNDLKVLEKEKVKQAEISIEQLQHDEDIIIIDSSSLSTTANTKYNTNNATADIKQPIADNESDIANTLLVERELPINCAEIPIKKRQFPSITNDGHRVAMQEVPKTKPKIISNERINLDISVKNNEKIDYHEIKSLRRQLKKEQKKLHKETEKRKELHIKLMDYKKRDKNLTNINIKLQKIISFSDAEDTLDVAMQILDAIQQPLSVGFVRKSDNMIYLGNGEWMLYDTYKSVIFNSKDSPSEFVKNIAMEIFGSEVLLESSVFGKPCNKKGRIPEKPALNSQKLCAIHEIFKKYLLDLGVNPIKTDQELKNVPSYISDKISELNKLQMNILKLRNQKIIVKALKENDVNNSDTENISDRGNNNKINNNDNE
ncbi:GRIP and coiled-coil domain-containing protein PFC0235w isoform X4 [Solenopsis invicta]|uniref:GRIP and coiled-coil domain-containing protein PFC0235w isoform X4 n=1 Tax=Solenopsis invicta TaxID=13686 RepID=UPI00193D4218|nr:GRIP and coiled-coil domain-containing protein PFC0235w isoform X4 [Solenopsis invicta]